MAAVLGISVDACARDAEPSAVPVAAYEVPSASPSGTPPTITTSNAIATTTATAEPQAGEKSCASKPPPGEKACGTGTCSGAKSCASAAANSTIPDSARVVAALQPRLRACYQKQLAVDPSTQGSVTLTIEVAGDGSVTSVTPGPTKLPPVLVACLAGIVQRVTFSTPTNGPAKLTVPVSFKK